MIDADPGIFSRIGELADQEKQLRNQCQGSPVGEQEQRDLGLIEAELDQCWEL